MEFYINTSETNYLNPTVSACFCCWTATSPTGGQIAIIQADEKSNELRLVCSGNPASALFVRTSNKITKETFADKFREWSKQRADLINDISKLLS